jgi:hypothetical protein
VIDGLATMEPGEVLICTVDFITRPLNLNESLSSVASSSITMTAGSQNTLVVSAPSVSGTVLEFTLSNPSLGCTYIVEVLVNTVTLGGSTQVRAAVVQVVCSLL